MSSYPQKQGGNRNLDSYVGVHTRVAEFRHEHPSARLTTAVLKDEPLTVRCEIYLDGNDSGIPSSSGMADESGGMGGRGNSTLEKVETAAVGRALAFLGYEVKEGIASREELEKATLPLRAVQEPTRPAPATREREELLQQVTARCVELGYDTKRQLEARSKAAKMSDEDIRKKAISSLDKLIEARHKEEARLRTAIYHELNSLYKSDEEITAYLAQNANGIEPKVMPLEDLKRLADLMEIK